MSSTVETCKVVALGTEGSMKAFVLEQPGDFKKLSLKAVEVPKPGPTQIRVRIAAATTNPVDFKHASFEGLSAFPAVFGCDGAGIVDEVGSSVTEAAFAKGDRVHFFGNVFACHGTFADYAVADAMAVAKIPAGMTWADAAVTPCALWTAYEALFDRMRLTAGQSIFVAAGAGGVGHFAVQLAQHVGAKVLCTASGANVAPLREKGVTVIDYKEVKSVKEAVLAATDGLGVDCAFDMLGESEAKETMGLVRFGGQYTQISVEAPSTGAGGHFFAGLTIHHVFTPGNVVRPDHAARFMKIAAEADALVVKGVVKPRILKVVPFAETAAALEEQASGRTSGKLLISMVKNVEELQKPASEDVTFDQ